jgi:hypothetical protein
MDIFKYQIFAQTHTIGEYVLHLLQVYGLNYPWKILSLESFSSSTIILRTSPNLADELLQNLPTVDCILTTDFKLLTEYGLYPIQKTEKKDLWGYISRSFNDSTEASSYEEATLVPLENINPIASSSQKWMVDTYVIDSTMSLQGFSFKGQLSSHRQKIVFAVDLMKLLDDSISGSVKVPMGDVESWADIFGYNHHQGIANQCYVDKMLNLIFNTMSEVNPEALPLRTGFYPIGKTAPLIITGDSDDATPSQILDYLKTIESCNAKANILLKQFESYDPALLTQVRNRGHDFGIHPFSSSGNLEGYEQNFENLAEIYRSLFSAPIPCVRNHYFQYIDQQNLLRLERKAHVLFDLNCVAASGHTWIGSGSGIGFPLPYPPQNEENDVKFHPLQLPTIIEDDVFLFVLDYCYQFPKTGVELPIQLCLMFLSEWVIKNRLPATINLHPEHVTPSTRKLLDEIVLWIQDNKVWTPSLTEFAKWIEMRNQTIIHVTGLGEDGIQVTINSHVPLILKMNRLSGLNANNNDFISFDGKQDVILVPHNPHA